MLHLPTWLPGMAFKKKMAIAREYSKEYLEQPFEYALQKAVTVLSITCLVRTLNDLYVLAK